MPTISHFYGIVILMFWDDHAPPHFHVKYAEYRASFDIQTLSVAKGSLPPQAKKLVKIWAEQHKDQLFDNWKRCSQKIPPNPIEPLE